MIKKIVAIALFVLSPIVLCAQTARTFTVQLSSDGKASMQVYLPENPNGKAVVGCPGGGYSGLAINHEGKDWVNFFNNKGIAYFILTYRMPNGNRTIPMTDAQAAIRTVRDSADAWNVSRHAVGIMGFSAGGHLASTTACHAPIDARPDFQILFYPVISMLEKQSHKGSCVNFLGKDLQDEKIVKKFSNMNAVRRHRTPPAIIFASADDDKVPTATNAIPYFLSLRKAGIPAELHVYPTGKHGWGFRNRFSKHYQMVSTLGQWLDELSLPNNKAVRVACIGNSITDGHGIDMVDVNSYPAQMQRMLGPDFCVKNFGVSGRTMLNNGDHPYMIEKSWEEAKAFNPDIVVIKLGTNDSKPVNWTLHSQQYTADMQQMIDELKALPSKPLIYLCTPLQANHVTTNTEKQIRNDVIANEVIPMIRKVAKKNKIEIIDLYPEISPDSDAMSNDGIHPSAKGAGIMAKKIAEVLRKAKAMR